VKYSLKLRGLTVQWEDISPKLPVDQPKIKDPITDRNDACAIQKDTNLIPGWLKLGTEEDPPAYLEHRPKTQIFGVVSLRWWRDKPGEHLKVEMHWLPCQNIPFSKAVLER